MIKCINFKYKIQPGDIVINTTSRSDNWSRGLSPFYLGPVDLYDGYISQTVESGWQYTKIFEEHLENDGSIGARYFKWAQEGWNSRLANRYPMGRSARPLFSYWAGEKFDYIEARKKIYIPLYTEAVKKTSAFKRLQNGYQKMLEKGKLLHLLDFDSHSLEPGTFDYWNLWNNPNIKVGHSYVLAMLLEGVLQ